mmetsp:Transcript_5908/g.18804  ORF Transcript_5908/g.18804 Transcript_5908/m.18804 type:complete len:207 (-) Transcript_5908:457-1077(-)
MLLLGCRWRSAAAVGVRASPPGHQVSSSSMNSSAGTGLPAPAVAAADAAAAARNARRSRAAPAPPPVSPSTTPPAPAALKMAPPFTPPFTPECEEASCEEPGCAQSRCEDPAYEVSRCEVSRCEESIEMSGTRNAAAARVTKCVLPPPGGPYNNSPAGGAGTAEGEVGRVGGGAGDESAELPEGQTLTGEDVDHRDWRGGRSGRVV